MRTTLTLDDDVYESVKAMAQAAGTSIGAVVSELVRRGLRPRLPATGDDLPVFPIPPSAEIIPSSRVSALLADEGEE
jgi:hypothetical protein